MPIDNTGSRASPPSSSRSSRSPGEHRPGQGRHGGGVGPALVRVRQRGHRHQAADPHVRVEVRPAVPQSPQFVRPKPALAGLPGDVHLQQNLRRQPVLARDPVDRGEQLLAVDRVRQGRRRQHLADFVPLHLPDLVPPDRAAVFVRAVAGVRERRGPLGELLRAVLTEVPGAGGDQGGDLLVGGVLRNGDQGNLARVPPRGPRGVRDAPPGGGEVLGDLRQGGRARAEGGRNGPSAGRLSYPRPSAFVLPPSGLIWPPSC